MKKFSSPPAVHQVDGTVSSVPPEVQGLTPMWSAKDGRKIRIVDMDDRHLLNTIKFLKGRMVELALTEKKNNSEDEKFYAKMRAKNIKHAEASLNIMNAEAERRKLGDWAAFGIKSVEVIG
jgi:hypothetical protein